MDVSKSRDMSEMSTAALKAVWIAFVVASTVAGSLAFACAAPLAAIGAVAGLKMRPGEGAILVGTAWLANQLLGYLVIGYPQTWDSYAWGAVMGVAAFAGWASAVFTARVGLPASASFVAAFAAAFLAYEAALFAATAVLEPGDAFSAGVIWQVFVVDAVAFVAFVLLHHAAVLLNILRPQPQSLAA